MYIWRRHNFSQINRPRKTVKFSDISYQTSSTNCQTIRFFTVVTLYLLPELNVRLMPQLAKLKPGSRILSHDFDMRGAKPVQVVDMTIPDAEDDQSYGGAHTLYKWVVPWETDPPAPGNKASPAPVTTP